MFLSAINLSLLSLCYLGSNNTIVDSSFEDTPYYDSDSGCYVLKLSGFQNHKQLLRYDNQTLMWFETPTYSDSVGFEFWISQSLNFSCFFTLTEEMTFTPRLVVRDSFDCVKYIPNADYDNFYNCYTVMVDPSDSRVGSYEDWTPYVNLYIRLLDEYTYSYGQDGGYSGGYTSGYTDGTSSGYSTGYTDGYQVGTTDGYTQGFETGSSSGYVSGYADALNTHSFTFTNLFGSIADTPILIIRRLFGFDIFGVGLISVFMSLFTALIVIHLIKKVF